MSGTKITSSLRALIHLFLSSVFLFKYVVILKDIVDIVSLAYNNFPNGSSFFKMLEGLRVISRTKKVGNNWEQNTERLETKSTLKASFPRC